MTLFSISNNKGRRIIVEGPDSVGKDTFIAGLQDFINGVDRFSHRNLTGELVGYLVNRTTKERIPVNSEEGGKLYYLYNTYIVNDPDDEIEDVERHARKLEQGKAIDAEYEYVAEQVFTPLYANTISHRSIHSKDGSPESEEFLRKLDGGEITDQNQIAEEYLQVHFDLENLAVELEGVLSLVIMNRSLISYHAMQIQALGFVDKIDKWKKLWKYSKQSDALFVRLTAPVEVIRERLAARQGSDFRGDVENFYMDKWKSIEEGFQNFQSSGLCKNSITFDTTSDMDATIAVYEQILHWVTMGQIADSMDRGEGMSLPFPANRGGLFDIN